MSERTERMSEVIRRELSTLMLRENKLEGLLLTIIAVETSPDMKHAYVYLSMIEQEVSKGKALGLLNRCKGEWQHELGKRISAKFTPRLHFDFDNGQERGDRVLSVLEEIERQKAREEALRSPQQ
ncbi:ribosome-binding factor A [Verrucomicrobium sp. GAS474]|uniref:30S ribosome-binding factor RbfA n=1 Tax=Verrucomicrobium sp. GAS474 TaxID=1882831 RepID=UPI00087B1BB8|nr:30S ribosome-binding factor RbfA [Verrucomicrobium sp. GAS474]SDU26890.1 ribosome-binding factor A [Verrucomicrobium sp. GAS474]